jgi:phenylacetate-CoA ligase
VVHVLSASYWSFLLAAAPALLAARALGKRAILNYHSGEAPDHLARWGVLVHPWLRLAHEIVVPSEFLRRVFAGHGYDARVVPNVVDVAAFRYRERSRLRPRLLSTRNLEAHYQVDNTIDAFAILKRSRPDATLTIAGYGSRKGDLLARASTVGEGVTFVGRVEPRDMPRLYSDHDIFLNSSVVDNQPVSILEAFAAGLPVVSTATGDIAAMLCGGAAGKLVPPEDPAAMAEAVESLLRHPDHAMALASRGREEAERYSWPRVRREWHHVYAARV